MGSATDTEGAEMPHSLARRVLTALFASAAITAAWALFDLRNGLGGLDREWTHTVRLFSGMAGWLLIDLLVIGLRSLRRREA